jgi:hypothetical protein
MPRRDPRRRTRGRSPEELGKVLAADYDRMGGVVKEIGFKPA